MIKLAFLITVLLYAFYKGKVTILNRECLIENIKGVDVLFGIVLAVLCYQVFNLNNLLLASLLFVGFIAVVNLAINLSLTFHESSTDYHIGTNVVERFVVNATNKLGIVNAAGEIYLIFLVLVSFISITFFVVF